MSFAPGEVYDCISITNRCGLTLQTFLKETPLHVALKLQNVEAVKLLLESSSLDVVCCDTFQRTKVCVFDITRPQSNLRRAVCRKGPIDYNGTPQLHPQNCLFPFDDHHPHLIHPSLDRPHSPTRTASGSYQPFCHNTLRTDRQTDTDRPTDGRGECSVT